MIIRFCISVLISISTEALASDLYSIADVKQDYLRKINNEEPDRHKPLKINKVNHQEKDVNGDDKLDLLIFEYYHCGSATGCRSDIYLCVTGKQSCNKNGYCFAEKLQ